MKKVIYKYILLLVVLVSGAQLLAQTCNNTNGGLDYQIINPSQVNSNSWINNKLDNWKVSHGDPTINAFNYGLQDQWVWMFALNHSHGEGMIHEYNFVQYEYYEISYKLKWIMCPSPFTGEFWVQLANSVPSQSNNGTGSLPTVAGMYVDKIKFSFAGGSTWMTITKLIRADNNYSQLWFHPYWRDPNIGSTSIQIEVGLNDVCIKHIPVDVCDFTPNFTNNVTLNNGCAMSFTNQTLPSTFPGIKILRTDWDFGDGNTAEGINVLHHYDVPGRYQVKMTVWMSNGIECCKKEIIKTFRATSCPAAPCDKLQFADFYIYGNGPIETHITGIPNTMINDFGYFWELGDGNYGSGSTYDHSYNNTGNFDIKLTIFYFDDVTGTCCSREITRRININSTSNWKKESGSTQDFPVENKASLGTALIIAPNPSNGLIELNIENGDEINSVNVFDLSGKSVYRVADISEHKYSLDLSFLNQGMYIILVNENEADRREFNKIVIE